MLDNIEEMVQRFEAGRVTRRQLIGGLGAMMMSAMAAPAGAFAGPAAERTSSSTLQSVGLNHVALRVPDVARSREFYQKHLGLEVLRSGDAGQQRFNFGPRLGGALLDGSDGGFMRGSLFG